MNVPPPPPTSRRVPPPPPSVPTPPSQPVRPVYAGASKRTRNWLIAGAAVLFLGTGAVGAVISASINDDDDRPPNMEPRLTGTPIQIACRMVAQGASETRMVDTIEEYLADSGIDDATTRAATAANVVGNAQAGEGC